MIIFVDIDQTICFSNPKDYSQAIPILRNIKKINDLYDKGNTIVYWTARGTEIIDNKFLLTLEQLKSWGCKFHELRFGKPIYDLLFDDKACKIEEI